MMHVDLEAGAARHMAARVGAGAGLRTEVVLASIADHVCTRAPEYICDTTQTGRGPKASIVVTKGRHHPRATTTQRCCTEAQKESSEGYTCGSSLWLPRFEDIEHVLTFVKVKPKPKALWIRSSESFTRRNITNKEVLKYKHTSDQPRYIRNI